MTSTIKKENTTRGVYAKFYQWLFPNYAMKSHFYPLQTSDFLKNFKLFFFNVTCAFYLESFRKRKHEIRNNRMTVMTI